MARSVFCEEHRAQLIERMASLGPDTGRRWGTLSPHAAILHMRDGLRWATGEMEVTPVRLRVPTGLMRWLALRLPFPWPHGAPTLPELDQAAKPPPSSAFDQDRDDLVAHLERFARGGEVVRPRHPVFGWMTERDWGIWAYRHTDHHLRQFGL